MIGWKILKEGEYKIKLPIISSAYLISKIENKKSSFVIYLLIMSTVCLAVFYLIKL